jgi:hypothetical protein
MKDLDGALELHHSYSFSIDMLPSGFGTLSCCLPSRDSFGSWWSLLISWWSHLPNPQLEAAQAPHSLEWLELAMVLVEAIGAGRLHWFGLRWHLQHFGLILLL